MDTPICILEGCENKAKASRQNTAFGKYCSKHYERKRTWGRFHIDATYKRHNVSYLTPTPELVVVGDRYYMTVHAWIRRNYGKPGRCEALSCTGKSVKYEWANLDKKYSRNIATWKQLCASCHRLFDRGYDVTI